MDLLFWGFVAILVLLVLLIVVFLFFLSKQGDERFKHIKTKAMANSFIATVGALVVKLCYAILNPDAQPVNGTLSNLSLLITIAIIFLISLVWQKRKYGG